MPGSVVMGLAVLSLRAVLLQLSLGTRGFVTFLAYNSGTQL